MKTLAGCWYAHNHHERLSMVQIYCLGWDGVVCAGESGIKETCEHYQTSLYFHPIIIVRDLSVVHGAILFTIVKHIPLCLADVDNLRTAISTLFQNCTFFAIISVTQTRSIADHTTSSKTSIVAFITKTNEGGGANVRITNNTFPIAFLAQSSNRNTRLLSAPRSCINKWDGGGCMAYIIKST